jgi:hypothetical protein
MKRSIKKVLLPLLLSGAIVVPINGSAVPAVQKSIRTLVAKFFAYNSRALTVVASAVAIAAGYQGIARGYNLWKKVTSNPSQSPVLVQVQSSSAVVLGENQTGRGAAVDAMTTSQDQAETGGGGAAVDGQVTVLCYVNQQGMSQTVTIGDDATIAEIVVALGLPEGTNVSFYAEQKIIYELKDVPRGGMVQVVCGQGRVTDPRFFPHEGDELDEDSAPGQPLCARNLGVFKDLTGRSYLINISQFTSLPALKKHFALQWNCLSRDVRLILMGRLLRSSDEFRASHIEANTLIHAIKRPGATIRSLTMDDSTKEKFRKASSSQLKDWVIVEFLKQQYKFANQELLDQITLQANERYQQLCTELGKTAEGEITADLIGSIYDPVALTDELGRYLSGALLPGQEVKPFFSQDSMAQLDFNEDQSNALLTLACDYERREYALWSGAFEDDSNIIEPAMELLNQIAAELIAEKQKDNVTFAMIRDVLLQKLTAIAEPFEEFNRVQLEQQRLAGFQKQEDEERKLKAERWAFRHGKPVEEYNADDDSATDSDDDDSE